MSAIVTAAPTYVGVEIPQSYVLLDYHEAVQLAAKILRAAADLDEPHGGDPR